MTRKFGKEDEILKLPILVQSRRGTYSLSTTQLKYDERSFQYWLLIDFSD